MEKISPIRILIADDHPVVREGLAALINHRAGMTVGAEVSNGRVAVAALQEISTALTHMDVRMPEIIGAHAKVDIR